MNKMLARRLAKKAFKVVCDDFLRYLDDPLNKKETKEIAKEFLRLLDSNRGR